MGFNGQLDCKSEDFLVEDYVGITQGIKPKIIKTRASTNNSLLSLISTLSFSTYLIVS